VLAGYVELSTGSVGAIMVASYAATVCASELYLHRARAHRAVTFHPAVCQLMRMWLWLTTYGVTVKTWVAVHRKHHAKCDTAEDPHSPLTHGLWTILTRGTLLYRKAVRDAELVKSYGVGVAEDWMDLHFYTRYRFYGALVLLALEVALFGLAHGALIWLFQVSLLPLWASGFINGLFHTVGYRNHATGDASRNFFPIGLLFGGAELHNNHHACPASAKMSQRWWEFDAGYLVLRTLSLLRLARINRL
jgi:stearoyl-CoA desaturase (Delta-9 desaturase)